jgi:hypothetical protein
MIKNIPTQPIDSHLENYAFFIHFCGLLIIISIFFMTGLDIT